MALPKKFKVQAEKSEVPNQPFEDLANTLGLESYFGWKEEFAVRLHLALESAYDQGFADGSKKPLSKKKPSTKGLKARYKNMHQDWEKAKRA